ncbi:MAG TPA: hypothetical protein VFK34_00520 [Marmoricola sp.]|nr:hypothetical protein [Marmoricola sp.]
MSGHRMLCWALLTLVGTMVAACAGSDDSGGRHTGPSESPATATRPSQRAAELLLATQAASDGLVLVDPSRRSGSAVVDRVRVGAAPWDVEVTHDGDTAYVSTAEGLAVVDVAARRRTALVPYRHQPASVEHGEYRAGGMGLAVAPDGRRVYVAVHRGSGDDVLEVFDTAARRFVDEVPVGLRAFDVLVSADGTQVYTVDHDSFSVHVVDTVTLRARRIPVAPFGTAGGLGSWEKPHYAVIAPDGDLLLPYQGTVLVRLDPVSGTTTRRSMTANSHQHGVSLTQDGRLLVVGTGSFGNATGGPNLTVRDVATGAEHLVALDRPHETVVPWTDPRTGHLVAVLSGGYTRPGGFDGITLVDLSTDAVRQLRVPGLPQTLVRLPG